MTKEEAIRTLCAIDVPVGNCALIDEETHEAISMAIEALSKPSLPSNLDEVAEEYAEEFGKYLYGISTAFKAGAEWMAGQEVKIGETKIYLEDDGDEPPYSQEWLDLESTEFKLPDGAFQSGDEVEVILRKKQ